MLESQRRRLQCPRRNECPSKERASRQRANTSPSSTSLHKQLLRGCGQIVKAEAEGMVRIKGLSSHLRVWIKGMCLQASRSGSKVCVFLPQGSRLEVEPPTSNQAENLPQVFPPFLDHSSSQMWLTSKNSHCSTCAWTPEPLCGAGSPAPPPGG